MFNKIKRLGSDTAVYGVSTIVGRFLTFLLTPFYTHLLLPAELGIVATVFAYIAVMNVVYGYGMESAYMKYVSTLEIGTRKQVFSVPFLAVALTSLLLSSVLLHQADALSSLMHLPSGSVSLVMYAAAILCLDSVAIVPFASLRMDGKAVRFAVIKIAGIVINVGCNLFFLIHLRMGVEGVFLAGVISSAATLLMLIPTVLPQLTVSWHGSLFAALLRFGLPYVPAGLASMMIQVIDRPILEALKGPGAVGIYQANYRLGVFMMLVVSMYDFAWRPFFLTHASDPDAKPLFARILTYFTLVATSVFLFLSFFLGDIVRLPVFWGHPMIAEPYWIGLQIVPVVLLAYLFLGIYNNLMAGIYIEKKTHVLPAVTITGAAVNVAVNYILIPLLGLMGAAIATLASYFTMAVLLYVLVQRFYPVDYELGRLGKILASAGAVYLLNILLPQDLLGPAVKLLLLILFFVMMYWMRFFTSSEVKGMISLFRRSGRPESRSNI